MVYFVYAFAVSTVDEPMSNKCAKAFPDVIF